MYFLYLPDGCTLQTQALNCYSLLLPLSRPSLSPSPTFSLSQNVPFCISQVAESFRPKQRLERDPFRPGSKHSRIRIRVRHSRVSRHLRVVGQIFRAGIRDEEDRPERRRPAAADFGAVRGRRRQLQRNHLQTKILIFFFSKSHFFAKHLKREVLKDTYQC